MGNNRGSIWLSRSLIDHELWLQEPFTRGQAWVDLLLLANHTDGVIRRRGVKVNIRRGEVGYGLRELAARWRWSVNKIRRYFDELKTDTQIHYRMDTENLNVTSLICITNYENFQTMNTETDTVTDTKTDTRRIQNKNEKKESKSICESSTLFSLWNRIVKGRLPTATALSEFRKKKCISRLNERPLTEWAEVFEKLAASDFCQKGNWCTFDWIIKNTDNALKVLEGKYDNPKLRQSQAPQQVTLGQIL